MVHSRLGQRFWSAFFRGLRAPECSYGGLGGSPSKGGLRAPLSLRVTSPILRSILGTPTKTAVLVLNAPSRPIG